MIITVIPHEEYVRLYLPVFTSPYHPITPRWKIKRNLLVAALAEEIYFAHITPGGKTERLSKQATKWQIPIIKP